MTAAYDIERVAVAAEQLLAAIDAADDHTLPDWLAHRLTVVRMECAGLRNAMKEHHELRGRETR